MTAQVWSQMNLVLAYKLYLRFACPFEARELTFCTLITPFGVANFSREVGGISLEKWAAVRG